MKQLTPISTGKTQTGKPSTPNTSTAPEYDALLKPKAVAEIVGTSVSWIYRAVREGRGFPAPIKMGARCTRWKSSQVMAWIHAQK